MNGHTIRWTLWTGLTAFLALFAWSQLRHYWALHDICSENVRIYRSFLSSEGCSNPGLRVEFEKLHLVNCAQIEHKLKLENPSDCAIKRWVQDGPIGQTLSFFYYVITKMMDYVLLLTLFSLVVIVVIMFCGVPSSVRGISGRSSLAAEIALSNYFLAAMGNIPSSRVAFPRSQPIVQSQEDE